MVRAAPLVGMPGPPTTWRTLGRNTPVVKAASGRQTTTEERLVGVSSLPRTT